MPKIRIRYITSLVISCIYIFLILPRENFSFGHPLTLVTIIENNFGPQWIDDVLVGDKMNQ